VQHATCSMQRAACNVQHATCSMQRAACKMQPTTCNLRHAEPFDEAAVAASTELCAQRHTDRIALLLRESTVAGALQTSVGFPVDRIAVANRSAPRSLFCYTDCGLLCFALAAQRSAAQRFGSDEQCSAVRCFVP
jgi:hypothetical protein